MRYVVEGLWIIFGVLAALDAFRLRRRLRYELAARSVEEALGPPRIGDITMPDPSDPRWTLAQSGFSTPEKKYTKTILRLDAISVTDDGYVYIGHGPPMEGGETYGKRVLQAYRRRLAEKARGGA